MTHRVVAKDGMGGMAAPVGHGEDSTVVDVGANMANKSGRSDLLIPGGGRRSPYSAVVTSSDFDA